MSGDPCLQSRGGDFEEVGDVVIGLDFGTSCTKVVIQDHYAQQAWAVPFAGLAPDWNPFLVPSRLWLDGSFADLFPGGNRKAVADLKRPLLAAELGDDETWHRALVASYIALVLRRAREWLLESKRDLYARRRICWALNVGIPSAGYDDRVVIGRLQELARCGWLLSTLGRRTSLDETESLIADSPPLTAESGICEGDINVIPEIVAEVVGYARSDERSPGLHLIVDVGAGTVDVAGFTLDRTSVHTDRFELLTAMVEALGAYELHAHRMREMEGHLGMVPLLLPSVIDPLQPLPETATYIQAGYRDEWDVPFYDKCRALVRRSIYRLKHRRAPGSDRWRTALPIFLCGGGNGIQIYQNAVEGAFWELREGFNINDYNLRYLPLPERLEAAGLTEHGRHRLGVAWGLSFPRHDIDEILPPHKIPDTTIRPPERDTGDDYISKDQV